MQNNYSSYLYYRGEKENPFTSQEDLSFNRHMWWCYEYNYFHDKSTREEFPNIVDFIKHIVNNKLDYADPNERFLNQYKNSSPYFQNSENRN